MESQLETEQCVICGIIIDLVSLTFEQYLIDDKEFCRKCWDGIMGQVDPVEIFSGIQLALQE